MKSEENTNSDEVKIELRRLIEEDRNEKEQASDSISETQSNEDHKNTDEEEELNYCEEMEESLNHQENNNQQAERNISLDQENEEMNALKENQNKLYLLLIYKIQFLRLNPDRASQKGRPKNEPRMKNLSEKVSKKSKKVKIELEKQILT